MSVFRRAFFVPHIYLLFNPFFNMYSLIQSVIYLFIYANNLCNIAEIDMMEMGSEMDIDTGAYAILALKTRI